MAIEFSYAASPELQDRALRYLLRRRGGKLLPVILVVLPILLVLLGADPEARPFVWILAGAALMILAIFLLAVAYRRRVRRRMFERMGDRAVHVAIAEEGVSVRSALGASTLAWSAFERLWAGPDVVLVFLQGWQYIVFPRDALPAGALEMLESHVTGRR